MYNLKMVMNTLLLRATDNILSVHLVDQGNTYPPPHFLEVIADKLQAPQIIQLLDMKSMDF